MWRVLAQQIGHPISEIDEFVRIDVKYLKTSNISAYKWKFCHLFLFINIFSR